MNPKDMTTLKAFFFAVFLSSITLTGISSFISCSNNVSQLDTPPTPASDNPTIQNQTFFLDADADGFGDPNHSLEAPSQPEGYASNDQDCNDENKKVNPQSSVPENKDPALDFNCDGTYSWMAEKEYNEDFVNREKNLIEIKWDPIHRKIITLHHETEDPNSAVVRSIVAAYDSEGHRLSAETYKDIPSLNILLGSIEYRYNTEGDLSERLQYEFSSGSLVLRVREVINYNGGKRSTAIAYRFKSGSLVDSYSQTYTYDSLGNPSQIIMRDGDFSTPVTSWMQYTYDSEGNRLTQEWHDGDLSSSVVNRSARYTYNSQGSPSTVERHDGDLSSPVTSWEQYTYDSQGNLSKIEYRQGDLSSPVTSTNEFKNYVPIEQPMR